MKPSPNLGSPELRGRLEQKRESKLIGALITLVEHLQKYADAFNRVGAGGVSPNEGVPSEQIWFGNFVEHLVCIVEARKRGEGGSCDELTSGIRVEE